MISLDCSAGNITVGDSVCISASQMKLPSQQFMSEVVNQFGSLNPQLQTLYQAMQVNPATTVSKSTRAALILCANVNHALHRPKINLLML